MKILKRFYNNLKLEGKILFVLIPVISFTMIFISNFAGEIVTRVLVEKAIYSEADKLMLISRQFEIIEDNLDNTAEMICENPLIKTVLIDNVANREDEYKKSMASMLDKHMNIYKYIDSISVITTEGRIFESSNPPIYSDTDIKNNSIYNDIIEKKVGTTFIDKHKWKGDYGKGNKTILIAGRAVMESSTGKALGSVLIDINQSFIDQVYKEIPYSEGGKYYIVNEDGYIVSSSDDDMLNKHVLNDNYYSWIVDNDKKGRVFDVYGEQALITGMVLKQPGWHMISFIPVDKKIKENKQITYSTT